MMRIRTNWLAAVCGLAVLAACGSSSSSKPTYRVGGTVSGLAPSPSVVLQNNGGDDLTVSADGPFTFATRIAGGSAYAVTVSAQPAGQTCSVAAGTGTANADVGTVQVTCATAVTYAVGGTVSGLPPSASVVLQDNGGDDLTVSADGAFTFPTKVASGAPYAVTVLTQPAGQTCAVANGSGTVGSADVTNVAVTCAPNTYAIGGTVSGLAPAASLVVQNNGGDSLTISGNGPFAFPTHVASGAAYAVTVLTPPPGQICSVANPSGTVGAAAVTNVVITCGTGTFSVGGTVTGLDPGASLVLQDNGTDNLTVSANGAFTFAARPVGGSPYAVTILTQPATQICTVSNGSGTLLANVTNVAVACAPSFRLGGTAAGLGSVALDLASGLGETLRVTANGPFAFTRRLAGGAQYAVTATPADPGMVCTVANGTGTIGSADVTNVQVTCRYKIGGTVTGLLAATSVTLQDNGGDNLVRNANGAFTFATPVDNGAAYNVTVLTQPAGQTCSVVGAGTVSGAPVTTVGVVCASSAEIGATVLQRWTSPASWGSVWPDDGNMVQHARFSASTIVEAKSINWSWLGGTEPAPLAFDGFPAGTRFAGGPFLTEGRRYQATSGDAGLNLAGDMLVCAIVEPYFDPVHDGFELPIVAKGVASAPHNIGQGGWVLAQSHESFLFSYQVLDDQGNLACPAPAPGPPPPPQACDVPTDPCNHKAIAFSPTRFASGNVDLFPSYKSPLNTSYVVVCGGREGNTTRLAVNSIFGALNERDLSGVVAADCPGRTPAALDAAPNPATIGGYSVTSAAEGWNGTHPYPGRIYETAVWNEPASLANMQTKFEQAQGLVNGAASYTRNREGPYATPSGSYHTTWRHSPRMDPVKGTLFGLQGWNRVSYWMPGDVSHAAVVFAAGEDLTLWTQNGGATVQTSAVSVPSRSDATKTAQRVNLPAGASLSIPLDQAVENPNCQANAANCVQPADVPQFGPAHHTGLTYPIWDAAGPIQGQVWVRLPTATSGTLRVRYQQAAPDPNNKYDIDLSTLSATAWKRVYLSGTSSNVGPGGQLTAADTTTRGTLFLENAGSSPISFYAWGIDLTQIGGGGDAAFAAIDPGLAMYDWNAAIDSPGANGAESVSELTRANLDVLELSSIPAGTPGFCMSADAQPAAGLPWAATMRDRRTMMTWRDPASTASLYVNGTGDATHPRQLCFELTGSMSQAVCAAVPAGWAPGTVHNVKGCVSSGRQVRLYDGDTNTQLATATAPAGSVPDLSNGHVLVGNSQNVPDLTPKTPWHGYVSRALLCDDTGNPNACQ